MGKHSAGQVGAPETTGPKHSAGVPKKSHAGAIIALVIVAVLAAAIACALTVGRPYVAPYVDPLLSQLGLPTLAEPEPEPEPETASEAASEAAPADYSAIVTTAKPLAAEASRIASNAYTTYRNNAPTPIFANSSGVDMHVAVPTSQLTELLFHQASYEWALAIDSPLPETLAEDADESTGTLREGEPGIGNEMFNGSVLYLYRTGRKGLPNTAVDCGAPAGAPALSPVDGTVVLVEHYLLYNKYDDYQIHIQPTGRPDLDVVLIHLDAPCVKAGDRVIAGRTQIAQIRDLASLMDMQLAEYTAGDDPGNHTHICVNDATNGGYFGLVGAAVVDSAGSVVAPATITADTPIEDVTKMREDAATAAGTTDITLPTSTASTAETS